MYITNSKTYMIIKLITLFYKYLLNNNLINKLVKYLINIGLFLYNLPNYSIYIPLFMFMYSRCLNIFLIFVLLFLKY